MKEYRAKVSQLWTGVACTALFAVATVGQVVVALWNPDGSFTRPIAAAIVLGLFWGAWTALGTLIVVDYFVGRLAVSQGGVVQVGVFRTRGLEFDGVLEARWRSMPVGGSLKLIGASVRMTIELGNFSPADRAELIERLRELVPAQRQTGWEEFNRSRKQLDVAPRTSLITSLLLAAFFGGFAVLPVVMARQGFLAGPKLVVLSALNVAGIVYCLHMARRAWRRMGREGGMRDESVALEADASEKRR